MDYTLHPRRSRSPSLQTCPFPIFTVLHFEFIRNNLLLSHIPVHIITNSRILGHPCPPNSNSDKVVHLCSSLPCFHHSPPSHTLPLHHLEFPDPWQLSLLHLQPLLPSSSWASHSNRTQSQPCQPLSWKPCQAVASFSHSPTTAGSRGGKGMHPPWSSPPFQTIWMNTFLLLKFPDLTLLTSDYINNSLLQSFPGSCIILLHFWKIFSVCSSCPARQHYSSWQLWYTQNDFLNTSASQLLELFSPSILLSTTHFHIHNLHPVVTNEHNPSATVVLCTPFSDPCPLSFQIIPSYNLTPIKSCRHLFTVSLPDVPSSSMVFH